MKNLSIRFKITLWFAVALVLVVSVTYFIILLVSDQVIQKTIRDTLIETVENNVDEVEFYFDISDIDLNNDVDHFVRYKDGFLEIDDDFLDEVNEVYTSLYQSDGALLYGENPIARHVYGMEFNDAAVQTIEVESTVYYIFDRQLTGDGLDGLWLRGIVSEKQGEVQLHEISRISLIILPLIVLLAIIGGYLIARRALRPIQQISVIASHISKGGDLKKRIELGAGNDELHKLADSFNDMINRLDKSFESERQFTSDISHELRTPVSVIMAQCEYSTEKPMESKDYQKVIEVIRRQGGKMSKLINDMMDFIRLENGSSGYTKELVNMTELVRCVCADMAVIQENGITVTCEAEEDVMINGNAELLARLLTNLISNAYRYGKENGHTQVMLKENGEGIELSVADDGIGIAEEEREKIFRRFYQTDNSRSGGGTGLGLSMVYEIAQFHRGVIKVESEFGKGSVFILMLKKLI